MDVNAIRFWLTESATTWTRHLEYSLLHHSNVRICLALLGIELRRLAKIAVVLVAMDCDRHGKLDLSKDYVRFRIEAYKGFKLSSD
jgi:hypothetical protein